MKTQEFIELFSSLRQNYEKCFSRIVRTIEIKFGGEIKYFDIILTFSLCTCRFNVDSEIYTMRQHGINDTRFRNKNL